MPVIDGFQGDQEDFRATLVKSIDQFQAFFRRGLAVDSKITGAVFFELLGDQLQHGHELRKEQNAMTPGQGVLNNFREQFQFTAAAMIVFEK